MVLKAIRRLGQKVVHGARWLANKAKSGVQWVSRMGTKGYNFLKKIPIVGDLAANAADRLASTKIPGIGMSAKDIVRSAGKGVSAFDNLVSDAERLVNAKSVGEAKRAAKRLYTKARNAKSRVQAMRKT